MQQLKSKLQQYGPLRPLAWQLIVKATATVELQENESFFREAGTLAFLSSGLLKEYDSRNRSKPSIINFISSNQFFIGYNHSQATYIRACSPSRIYYLQWQDIKKLLHQFGELKTLYDGIADAYDHQRSFRQILLEERRASFRMIAFIAANRNILPLLKKKDIANYLHLNYNHFVRQYSKLL